MPKTRADQALVARGLAPDIAKAQALIMAGVVLAGTRRIDKPSDQISADEVLRIKGKDHPYVSRGGVKLAGALDHFQLSPENLICLDVGASTGGFTHVLLQRGAKKVYAVDSGTNQLDYRLRTDARVVVHEQTSAKDLTAAIIPEPVNALVMDVSFAPLMAVLPPVLPFAAPGAWLAALIKPQFELPARQVEAGGVVRDPALHLAACAAVEEYMLDQSAWDVLGIYESPITGAEGNREFFIAARRR